MALHLMRPEWLWSLVPALLLVCCCGASAGAAGSWSAVIAPELLQPPGGRQAALTRRQPAAPGLLGWVLAVLAASGPSWQKMPQPVHQKQDALVYCWT